MLVKCDNCDWHGDESEARCLLELDGVGDRLDAGSIVPYGECPECGCFCYLTETRIFDGDYKLAEGKGWFEVGGFVVRIAKTHDAVTCDIYKSGKESDGAMAGCWVLDAVFDNDPA